MVALNCQVKPRVCLLLFFITGFVMTGSLIFCYQNEVVLGGLLLQAAFSQSIGDPYEWSGSLMELWWKGSGLGVTVKLSGAE